VTVTLTFLIGTFEFSSRIFGQMEQCGHAGGNNLSGSNTPRGGPNISAYICTSVFPLNQNLWSKKRKKYNMKTITIPALHAHTVRISPISQNCNALRDSVMRFFASGFFHESPSPKPLIITLGSFQIFLKIRGDIRKSRCTTGVNDTDGKFAAGINNTSGKFSTSSPCVVDTGGK
jgi:hypothetical protein